MDIIGNIYMTIIKTRNSGIFNMRQPMLLIKDPKHIKDIFIKNSATFSNRAISYFLNVYNDNHHLIQNQ
jgi:hypothetical protein